MKSEFPTPGHFHHRLRHKRFLAEPLPPESFESLEDPVHLNFVSTQNYVSVWDENKRQICSKRGGNTTLDSFFFEIYWMWIVNWIDKDRKFQKKCFDRSEDMKKYSLGSF